MVLGGSDEKAARWQPFHVPGMKAEISGQGEIGGLAAAGIWLNIEVHALAFAEAGDSGPLKRAHMHEHVFGAAFRRNEAETLAAVEKLHGTSSHLSLVLRSDCRRTHCAPDFTLFVLSRVSGRAFRRCYCALSACQKPWPAKRHLRGPN